MYEIRLRRLYIAFCVILCVIGARAFALQVLEVGPPEDEGGSWKSRAGRPQPFSVHPRRGEIFYADGTPMAWNVPGYGLEIEWDAIDDRIVPTVAEFRASIARRARYEAERDAARLAEQRTDRARTNLKTQQDARRAELAAWRAERVDDLGRLWPVQIVRKDKPLATRWECTICATQVKRRGVPDADCRECGALPSFEELPPPSIRDLAMLVWAGGDAPIEVLIARIQEALVLSMRRLERHPDWKSHAFLVDISAIASETIELRHEEFGGLTPMPRSSRRVDPDARQIAGGTRFPSADDVRRLTDPARRDAGWHVFDERDVLPSLVGNSLLEAVLDDELRGVPGEGNYVYRRERNFGREAIITREVADGPDLHTTIRPELQRLAMRLAASSPTGGAGAAVVLDVRDGALLAMGSASRDGMNHARTRIAPGSVYKLVTAIAVLDSGIAPAETVDCRKKGRFPNGVRYTCAHEHGDVGLHDAFVGSCNGYFAQRGATVGAQALTAAAIRLGFDTRPLVPALGEFAAWEPKSRSKHVLGRDGKLWAPDLALMGIGQSTVLASAVQVATAYARIAADGRLVTPFVLQRDRPLVAAIPIDPVLARWAPLIREAARGVVAYPEGSAFKIRELRDVGAAGKTGTAEVGRVRNEFLNNALFVGYAPHDTPRYCAIVVYERLPSGRYGAGAAGPQVAKLLAEAMRE